MHQEIDQNRSLNFILGLTELLFSGLSLYHHLSLLYRYQMHPEILWAFQVPAEIIALNILAGLTGIYCAYLLLRNKMAWLKAYLIPSLAFLASFLLEVLFY